MISKNNDQILLSSLILLGALLFLGWCFKINHSVLSETTPYRAVMTAADGLQPGSHVFLKGVSVGSVEHVRLNTEKDNAEIALAIQSTLSLPEDSVLTLSKSMTGGSSLEISPGTSTHLLRANEIFKKTFIQPSLEQRISNYAFGGSIQN